MAQYNSYHWYESLIMWITLEILQLIHGTIYIYIHIHINVLIRYVYSFVYQTKICIPYGRFIIITIKLLYKWQFIKISDLSVN